MNEGVIRTLKNLLIGCTMHRQTHTHTTQLRYRGPGIFSNKYGSPGRDRLGSKPQSQPLRLHPLLLSRALLPCGRSAEGPHTHTHTHTHTSHTHTHSHTCYFATSSAFRWAGMWRFGTADDYFDYVFMFSFRPIKFCKFLFADQILNEWMNVWARANVPGLVHKFLQVALK